MLVDYTCMANDMYKHHKAERFFARVGKYDQLAIRLIWRGYGFKSIFG